ncbi:MAG: carboxypeptidase regulatory-like domain-containing protein [Bacteroidetes bacterium]|nr:carboxypeptidase regulatory-like domain-containing protein [Bacteroidota bacterium]
MKNIYIIITTLVLFTTFGCKKTVFNRTAEGRIIDATTGQGIEGAKVFLIRSKGEFLGPTTTEEQDTVYTDADGKFEFHFKKYRQWNYQIYAVKKDYFFDPSNDYTNWNRDNRKSLELKLKPQATLICNTVNSKGGNQVYITPMNSLINNANSTTTSFVIEGNKTIELKYKVTQNSGSFQWFDTSIYCHAFESSTLTINF